MGTELKIPPTTDAEADALYAIEQEHGSSARSEYSRATLLAAVLNRVQNPGPSQPSLTIHSPLVKLERFLGTEISDKESTAHNATPNALQSLIAIRSLMDAGNLLYLNLFTNKGDEATLGEAKLLKSALKKMEGMDDEAIAAKMRVFLNHTVHAIVAPSLYEDKGSPQQFDSPYKDEIPYSDLKGITYAEGFTLVRHLVRIVTDKVDPKPRIVPGAEHRA